MRRNWGREHPCLGYKIMLGIGTSCVDSISKNVAESDRFGKHLVY